jgi:predicted MFS family arabinose efflux permease
VASSHSYTLGEALHTRQWYLLTAILALNVTCGIAFISQASDAAQDIAGVTAATASVFVGVMGLFNGAGRIPWAALSDKIGRMTAFVGMLAVQAVSFLLLPRMYEASGKSYGTPFTVIGIIAAVAIVLPLITKMPAERTTDAPAGESPHPARR